MIEKLTIEGYDCVCSFSPEATKMVYMIYPALVPFEDSWIERMAHEHTVGLAMVYVPADKWNDTLTPWAEPGEAKGFPPFAGHAATFLKLLQDGILPAVEKKSGKNWDGNRDLLGVSLSGLFSLWQWMECDTFVSIASLSGSFWYDGFLQWFDKQPLPQKKGNAYFLLGVEEPHAKVKAYQSVGTATEAIVARLKAAGIPVKFDWVPGNHFSRPVHRAEKGLDALAPLH